MTTITLTIEELTPGVVSMDMRYNKDTASAAELDAATNVQNLLTDYFRQVAENMQTVPGGWSKVFQGSGEAGLKMLTEAKAKIRANPNAITLTLDHPHINN